jgi:hypothetical protein
MSPDAATPSNDLAATLSRFLDSDLSADECSALLEQLRSDAGARDALTILQLVRDAVGGVPALDDGYTLRILKRLQLR